MYYRWTLSRRSPVEWRHPGDIPTLSATWARQGTLCAYDRVVLPAGTVVAGHVERLDPQPVRVPVQAMASRDFSPNHRVVLQFDTLTLADGRNVPIRTREAGTAERIALARAVPTQSDDDDRREITARARKRIVEAKQEAMRTARCAIGVVAARVTGIEIRPAAAASR